MVSVRRTLTGEKQNENTRTKRPGTQDGIAKRRRCGNAYRLISAYDDGLLQKRQQGPDSNL